MEKEGMVSYGGFLRVLCETIPKGLPNSGIILSMEGV